eukprot:1158534-Pelagomonas_calceolata.AAC.11
MACFFQGLQKPCTLTSWLVLKIFKGHSYLRGCSTNWGGALKGPSDGLSHFLSGLSTASGAHIFIV